MMVINYLKADFIKTKHTPIRAAHLAIPVIAAFVFLTYYSYAPWDEAEKIQGFYEAIGIAFPILAGIFGAGLAEQEENAGACFQLLTAERKHIPFLSKLMLLLLMGLGSMMLASLLFGAGFYGILGNKAADFAFYVKIGIIMWGQQYPGLYLASVSGIPIQ